MAASNHLPGNSDRDRPSSETSTRCLREQSQRDFEVEFIGRILDRDPYYVDAIRVQANNLARRGESTRALQLDRRLTRLQPDRPIPWYNLACSYAVLGMIDPAFDALTRAVDLGYRHFRHMLRDPDLKALRQDPRFARILRRG
ncbi:TPR end-of-group domain-containing protein [Tautonia marina]|uniref:TPR end-of-group domain-containing protein n=1 Tax=Tautonia marina TaxID=2653855 RepID=UPI001261142E|nr:hypothetical protein [Tautonia marina]